MVLIALTADAPVVVLLLVIVVVVALCCAAFSRFYDSLTPRLKRASLSSEAIETDFADAYVPLPPSPSPCRNENHFSICYFSACVVLVYLDFPSLPPRLGRHFRHHYLHGIECSSTLSNVPGRRSKNIKTQINSRQIRSRHTRTHTHIRTYTHSYIHMQICKVTRATHRNMQTISAA